jgi:hypothetical protein
MEITAGGTELFLDGEKEEMLEEDLPDEVSEDVSISEEQAKVLDPEKELGVPAVCGCTIFMLADGRFQVTPAPVAVKVLRMSNLLDLSTMCTAIGANVMTDVVAQKVVEATKPKKNDIIVPGRK